MDLRHCRVTPLIVTILPHVACANQSRAQTVMNSTNVKEVKCSGMEVCANSVWEFGCDADDLCEVSCDDDFACFSSQFVGYNVKELKSNGDSACAGGTFNLQCTEDEPCEIQCEGDNACAGAIINADYVSEISCKDDNACAGTTITVTSAAEDFEVECGENSCVGLTLTANVSSDVKGFKCGEGGVLLRMWRNAPWDIIHWLIWSILACGTVGHN